MAGGMTKAQGRRSSKRKQKGGSGYGLKRIRLHEIPLVCPTCSAKRTVSSQQAYAKGGNTCKCGVKMAFDLKAMPKPQIQKK